MRTDFDQIPNDSRVTLHPRPDNPLHDKPVGAFFSNGYFYCDGNDGADGPDYYLGDVLKFIVGFTSGAIDDIAAERRRQIEKEGWTPEHDDTHTEGQMARAAGCYAWMSAQSDSLREVFTNPPPTWPEPWSADWWKPKDRRRDLVRAGALIVAEIERLDRKAEERR